jgi:hypothetical protein
LQQQNIICSRILSYLYGFFNLSRSEINSTVLHRTASPRIAPYHVFQQSQRSATIQVGVGYDWTQRNSKAKILIVLLFVFSLVIARSARTRPISAKAITPTIVAAIQSVAAFFAGRQHP